MSAAFTIGFTEGLFSDPARSDWPGDGPRPICWSAWYPAEEPARSDETLRPLFRVRPMRRDARPAEGAGALPLVLLSHGTGGTLAGLAWFAHALAAQGLVVAGVDHHGNTAREAYRAEGFLCWWERSRDLSVLVDHLLTARSSAAQPFTGRIDPARIFTAGFSLGGHAALGLLGAVTEMVRFHDWAAGQPMARGPREFPDLGDRLEALLADSAVFRASWERQSLAYRDPRIRAALLMSPAPTVRAFTPESLHAIDRPVVQVVGGDDREAPAEAGAQWLHGLLPASTLIRLGDTVGHYVFLEECTAAGRQEAPELCVDPPGVDRAAIHAQVAALALDLFGRK